MKGSGIEKMPCGAILLYYYAFSLPIRTLVHPGHTGVELQHPRINLGPRYDQDQDQRLGPGVVQEDGLGWAGGCCACCSACTSPDQLTARATLHFPSLSNNYPYTHYILLILYRFCLNKSARYSRISECLISIFRLQNFKLKVNLSIVRTVHISTLLLHFLFSSGKYYLPFM